MMSSCVVSRCIRTAAHDICPRQRSPLADPLVDVARARVIGSYQRRTNPCYPVRNNYREVAYRHCIPTRDEGVGLAQPRIPDRQHVEGGPTIAVATKDGARDERW
jgi:hypothetical protein